MIIPPKLYEPLNHLGNHQELSASWLFCPCLCISVCEDITPGEVGDLGLLGAGGRKSLPDSEVYIHVHTDISHTSIFTLFLSNILQQELASRT